MRRLFTLLFSFIIASCFAALTANSQKTGAITGRLVAEDGGLANVDVSLYPVDAVQRSARRWFSTATDEDGNFKFTGLSPRAYSIYVGEAGGYVRQFIPASEDTYYHIGDYAAITMVRGGVITGKVTTAEGEPMIGARVSAMMTRDAEGHPLKRGGGSGERTADDRGVYRLYGLPAGTYVIAVRSNLLIQNVPPYDSDTPTFYPSSTRDTASEVAVASGGEVAGLDIRYRGERGHIVSGIVTGAGESSRSAAWLYNIATGTFAGYGGARPDERAGSFAIRGVSDGEYEVVAQIFANNDENSFVAPPRRVTVRGADVGGIELKLTPRASIAGKIVVENQPNDCKAGREFSVEETIVSLRRDEKAPEFGTVYRGSLFGVAPDEKGEFTIRNVDPGRYFIESRLPDENWYVKSISAPASATAGANAKSPGAGADIARDGAALKAGDKLTGLTVTIARGGASLRGKVVAATAETRLPSRLRVHLAPVETPMAGDPLRYAETITGPDGSFALSNIAPGKYWLAARAIPEDKPADDFYTPVARDPSERAKLRKEAEALKLEVELKPCRRVTDQIMKFAK
jgi:hypothetical protein